MIFKHVIFLRSVTLVLSAAQARGIALLATAGRDISHIDMIESAVDVCVKLDSFNIGIQ